MRLCNDFVIGVSLGLQYSSNNKYENTNSVSMMQEGVEPLEEPDYDKILEKQDFFPKIFLVPSQIRLHKDEGLKVIKRSMSQPDKYQQQKVLPISVDEQEIKSFKKIKDPTVKHPAGHGLLSLFKKTPKRRIKLAICICVYSQPKHMLKSTIRGIQESYKYFREKAGILPHEIILTVIFDGIQKINTSKDQTENMISFFNEIDIKNGFVYKPYGKSLEQYLKDLENRDFNISKLDAERNQDVSLFTEEQMAELKTKLFQNQYNEYIRVKALIGDITQLKKQKNIKIQSLPHEINKKYQQLCLNFCIENNMYYQTQEQIQEYLSTKKNSRVKLIYEAISETELLCRRYLASREDKAILYPVRLQSSDLRGSREYPHPDPPNAVKQYNYMFFVVKHKNQGKLSSHMLFFQGFCKLFDPEYCMLTDVGIKPHKDAIYRMWAHMEQRPKCGGVCGYMGLKLENPSDELGYREDGFEPDNLDCLTRLADYFFSVQRAQQFEYHFSHMLDKPFESAFGYIHVLPGAFSGYRWKALKSVEFKSKQYPTDQNYNQISTDRDLTFTSDLRQDPSQDQQQTIMKRYLKTATTQQSHLNLEDSNMYLAQDRIMCLGIHALGYDLDYLPDAESTVDPVTSLTRLLGQRRRWINGSWFAFKYVSKHSYERTSCLFLIQLYYYILVHKLTWIGPAMFYIAMNLTLVSAVREYVVPLFQQFFNVSNNYQLYNYTIYIFNVRNVLQSIPDLINFIYILIIFSLILYSLLVNHNNNKFKQVYYMASSVLGLYGLVVLALLIYNSVMIVGDTVRNTAAREQFIIPIVYLRGLIIFILVGHALPVLWTCSLKKYVEMLTSLLSYLFYTPTYVNILQIFAFCRIDDLSWGTKGLDAGDVNLVAKQWQRRKYIFVLQYITTNVIIAYVCVKASQISLPRNIIILGTTCLVAVMLLFRLLPAAVYLLRYKLRGLFRRGFSRDYIEGNLDNGRRILNALRVIEMKIKEIEKAEVKMKKEAEYKKIANATSEILSRSLSNFGNKIRSKVAQHMVSNNLIPKKELLEKRNRLRRKINLRKRLGVVEEVSNEESQESNTNGNRTEVESGERTGAVPSLRKLDIRNKLGNMRNRKNGDNDSR